MSVASCYAFLPAFRLCLDGYRLRPPETRPGISTAGALPVLQTGGIPVHDAVPVLYRLFAQGSVSKLRAPGVRWRRQGNSEQVRWNREPCPAMTALSAVGCFAGRAAFSLRLGTLRRFILLSASTIS